LTPKPLILIILELGGTLCARLKATPYRSGRKPVYDRLLRSIPTRSASDWQASLLGLPTTNEQREVGHSAIGAGRIVHMDSTRIELMIQWRIFPPAHSAQRHERPHRWPPNFISSACSPTAACTPIKPIFTRC
jgi:bisphosphoglycerate-independent phosphoglycerate mutase (AlkP superfamily)